MTKKEFNLTVLYKDKERHYSVEQDSFVIGRAAESDVMFKSDLISRHHVEVSFSDNNIWLKDLGSSNGTWLDGKKIPSHQKVIYSPSQKLILGGKNGPQVSLKYAQEMEVTRINVAGGAPIFIPQETQSPPSPPVKQPLKLLTPKPEDPVVAEKKEVAEKSVFEQIKALIDIESQDNLTKAREEGLKIIKKAEQSRDEIIREGVIEGEKKIKDFELIVQEKETKLQARISELNGVIHGLNQNISELKHSLQELGKVKSNNQHEIKAQEQKLAETEAYLRSEYERLDKQNKESVELKDKLEEEYEAFKIEEKKARSKIELSIVEAQLQVTQLQSEAEVAKGQASTLQTQVQSLINQESLLKRNIEQKEQELSKRNSEYYHVSEKFKESQEAFQALKKEHTEVTRDLEEKQTQFRTLQENTQKLEEESDRHLKENETKLVKLSWEMDHLQKNFNQEKERQTKQIQASCDEIMLDHEAELSGLKAEKEKIQLDIEATSRIAQQDYDKVLAFAKNEAQGIIKGANSEAQKVRSEFESEFNAKKIQADEELALLADKKELLDLDIQNQKEQNEKSIVQTEEIIQKMLTSAKTEAKNIFTKAEKESAAQTKLHLHDLQMKQQELKNEISRLERERTEKMKHTEEEVQVTIGRAKTQAEDILKAVEVEAQENKKKQEKLLAELKSVELHNIKDLRVKAEEDMLNKRADRARAAATNVYAMITEEMYKARNKVLDDAFIESYTQGIKELVVDSLMDRVSADTSKLQQVLKTTEDVRAKEKQYWRRVSIGVGALVVTSLTLAIFPELISGPKQQIIAAFTEKKAGQSDAFYQQIQESRKKLKVDFLTTVEYKDSYVDNLLYTTDYLTKQSAKAYQDKWILELNDYFIQVLDVKDTTIIKFVSLEAGLLKDLIALKEEMTTENKDEIISQMKARESEFRQKLSGIFENPDKVSRYYEFSKKFWNQHYKQRK